MTTFIARQRDLRELVGEGVTGATELGFQDTLDLAKGRFDLITLEDRNLPEIIRKRLLKRVGGDGGPADLELNRRFEEVQRVRTDVWDNLLLGAGTGSGADLESFRQSYPFSPAFLSTLVYVSSALQRSRTALKLMRQLLVERREELRLGQLIPLGDLYDVLSRGGDQPFTEKLKAEFETAQKLYEGKLRPNLLESNGVADEDLETVRHGGQLSPDRTARVRAFQADDRLVKTLLLSALAPSVPALRDLTARKLSALNHGSFVHRIPGQEQSVVRAKLEKKWAGRFGEIKIIEGENPGVRLELVGIDVDSVVNSARHFDSQGYGARKAMIKRLLWEELRDFRPAAGSCARPTSRRGSLSCVRRPGSIPGSGWRSAGGSCRDGHERCPAGTGGEPGPRSPAATWPVPTPCWPGSAASRTCPPVPANTPASEATSIISELSASCRDSSSCFETAVTPDCGRARRGRDAPAGAFRCAGQSAQLASPTRRRGALRPVPRPVSRDHRNTGVFRRSAGRFQTRAPWLGG